MLDISSSLTAELNDKIYRDAYVGSQIRMTLPLQIRGLRESLKWTQSKLAKEAKMAQPRISELESPGERRLTIETLLRLASAFDVALQVRFVPFGKLVDWSENLDLNNFSVKPYPNEIEELKSASLRRSAARRRRPRVKARSTADVFVRLSAVVQKAFAVKPDAEDTRKSSIELASSLASSSTQLFMFSEYPSPSNRAAPRTPDAVPTSTPSSQPAHEWVTNTANDLPVERRIYNAGDQGTAIVTATIAA